MLGIAEARESARGILAQVYRGEDPIEARKPKAEVPTLRDFIDGDYATWAGANQRAYKQNLARLLTAFKALLDKKIDALVPLDLERWRAAEVERGLSLQTTNRDIASIKACLNRAVDWDLLAVNPLAKVKKSRVNDCVKVRYLSEKEEARLRHALDAAEERRRTERDTANHWRSERGYVLLPSMRNVAFTTI